MYRTSSGFTPTLTPRNEVPTGVFNNGEIVFERFIDSAGFGDTGTYYYVFRETLEDWWKRQP